MPSRLFQLRGVPEDEAEEVRALLEAHAIAFYETPAGNWGISSPALWSNDDAQAELARALIAEYQTQRALAARQAYEALRAAGEHPTLLDSLRRHPVRSIGFILIAVLVAYFSVAPFVSID